MAGEVGIKGAIFSSSGVSNHPCDWKDFVLALLNIVVL